MRTKVWTCALLAGLALLLSFPTDAQGPLSAHVDAVSKALQQDRFTPNTWMQGTGAPRQGLDIPALRTCSGFTMRLQAPHAEDALVAAGVALSAGRPSIYLVSQRNDLPWFLREVDRSYPRQVAVVEAADAKSALDKLRLLEGQSNVPASEPQCDTLIGCIMSGLSDTQYAEARHHLQAIDEALVRMGSKTNFCEGIRITAPTNFETPREALPRDLSAVRNSGRCVFYVYDGQSRPSGMWVEAGCAIGLGKRCTLLIPDRACLPPCLRGSALPPNVRVVVFGSHENLLDTLKNKADRLLEP